LDFNNIYFNYKLAKFFFAASFLVSYFTYINLTEKIHFNFPIVIILIYTIATFFTLFSKKINYLEFFLDIIFITAFIFSNFNSFHYFSILYLFPLFFFSLFSGSLLSYLLSVLTILFYSTMYKSFVKDTFDVMLNIGLNSFAFLIIVVAGIKLHKKLEEQLKYIKFLEQERDKSELYRKVYRMSTELAHEIRNPLASISAAAQLLKEGNINKSLLEMIYKESKRVDDILKGFIQFSKPSSNKKETFNLIFLIEDIVKNYNFDKKDIKLQYPQVFKIKTDRNLFESAISNIIKNSLEWAKSKVLINIYRIRNDLIIDVEDDGEGILDEEIDKIFEPFYTKRKKGTGLGLAIAKRNLMEINGDVFVYRSKLGGAGFKIVLKNVEVEDEGFSG